MNEQLTWADTIQTTGTNETTLGLQVVSKVDTLINGAYFKVELPKEFDRNSQFSVKNTENMVLSDLKAKFGSAAYKAPATGVTIEAPTRKLEIDFNTPTELIIQANDSTEKKISFTLKLPRVNLALTRVIKIHLRLKPRETLILRRL